MKKTSIARILLATAAVVCIGIFFIRLYSGASAITAGLWIALGVIIGIVAIAIKASEEKAEPVLIGSAVTLALSLMLISFFLGRTTAPERTASLPETTEAAATDISDTVSPTVFVTIEPSETPRPTLYLKHIYDPGMYKVGVDLPAGEYFLVCEDTEISCYFEIASDSSGSFESIITNDNFRYFSYVTVRDGEYLTVERASICVSSEGFINEDQSLFIEGMYKIGVDIPAGEYIAVSGSASDFAYIEITSDSRHLFESIITNDNFKGTKYITVRTGQYLKISNGYLKKANRH